VAQQAGDWAAQNILAGVDGKPARPFHYHDKGIMAMIGRKAAVAEVGEHRHELKGRIAFAAWLGVHAELLADGGAEVKAFLSWANEFYLRPHHRRAALLDPDKIDTPRIDW
jgi:NADH dehydrogenase